MTKETAPARNLIAKAFAAVADLVYVGLGLFLLRRKDASDRAAREP